MKKTEHVKVWISYANFEATIEDKSRNERVRKCFERGYNALKQQEAGEERVILLEAWKEFEAAKGDDESLQQVEAKFPKRVKKRRKVTTEEGVSLIISFINVLVGCWLGRILPLLVP